MMVGMTNTLLADIIERATTTAVVKTLDVAATSLGEELARELLREPEFREEFRQLARLAFSKALVNLQEDQ